MTVGESGINLRSSSTEMADVTNMSKTLETPLSSFDQQNNDNVGSKMFSKESSKLSGYEQSREDRIKENLERMQKLGIMDLALKLGSQNPTAKRRNTPCNRNTPPRISQLPPSGPVRRSSRLQNTTPISYTEVHLTKKEESLEQRELVNEGFKPEIYTEEHEKLLGDTKLPWTLFVDGYGKDGKRIYDPVIGKTCHQCRQKTLGQRTSCCKCNLVQGQFCGDCLYMRYGENVLEAKQNPDWICPACRGICNCSLCRQAKGWPATGTMYRKISSLGFKSVAHYLIQTKRAIPDSNNTAASNKKPISAKRSLPFSDMCEHENENKPPEHNEVKRNDDVMVEEVKRNEDVMIEPERIDDKHESLDSDARVVEKKETENDLPQNNEIMKHNYIPTEKEEDNKSSDNVITVKNEQESAIDAELMVARVVENDENFEGKSSSKSKKKPCLSTVDSIAGRLRQRRAKGC